MSNITLENLVSYSETIFNKPDNNSLSSLDNLIRRLAIQTDAFELCLLLLQYPQTERQRLACEVLYHLLTSHLTPINTQQKFHLQNFILSCISSSDNLDSYVVLKFIQIHSIVTKIGWFEVCGDQAIFQNLISNLHPLLSSSMTHHVITGVSIITETVSVMKMNSVVVKRVVGVVERGVCHSFRDTILHAILLLSIRLIRTYQGKFNDERGLGEAVVGMHGEVMGYTFIEGSDESSDESVQLPNSFKAAILEERPLKLLLEVYEGCGGGGRMMSQLISCMAQHSSIRRSFFNNQERSLHLDDVINAVITASQKATDSDSTHEFCRLLSRLKGSFQLTEMVRVGRYEEFISTITNFTLVHFNVRDLGMNSEYHLLNFWDKMMAPLPYLDPPIPHSLQPSSIFHAYVTPRLRDTPDNPLEDIEEVSQHLEMLCSIGRHDVASCYSLLNNQQLHYNVCWLLLIASHMTSHVTNEDLQHHAVFFCRTMTHSWDDKVEECNLTYLRHFSNAFLVQSTASNIESMIGDLTGVQGDDVVLSLITNKITENLNKWRNHHRVIKSSLQLLSTLAQGHTTGRKLIKLPAIRHLLTNHHEDNMGFLKSVEREVTKLRTSFYSCLSALLLVHPDDDAIYNSFFLPLDARMERIQMLKDADENKELEMQLWCVVRDMRGVVQVFNKKKYVLLYSYIFPHHISTITEALHHLKYPPHTTHQTFKLLTLFSDCNSSTETHKSILIFKHISFLLARYQKYTSTMALPFAEKELRGSWEMSKVILRSCHPHIGVMYLYQDASLPLLLSASVRLLLSVPASVLLDHPKLGGSYVGLVDTLTEHHGAFFCGDSCHGLDDSLQALLTNLHVLLQASPLLLPACCTSIDNICTYIHQTLSSPPLQLKLHRYPQDHPIHHHPPTTPTLSQPPPFLANMLEWLMGMVVFEECKNLWCLSRPLLVLILLFPANFSQLSNNISQTYNCPQLLHDLMKGIEDNISIKNRDRFTSNMSTFKHQMQQVLINHPNQLPCT